MNDLTKRLLIAELPALLLLAACGNGAAASETSDASPEASQPSGSAVTFQAVDVKQGTSLPTQEEAQEAYDRAAAAFGWFRLQTLPCDQASVFVDGALYQRVRYAGLSTMEELEDYLRGSFTQEVIDRLLAEDDPPRYRDVAGVLYVRPLSCAPDPCKGNAEVTVEPTAQDACVVHVTVEVLSEDRQSLAGLEVYSFPYQCVDGQWRFAGFQLVNAP
jgi:hypothetical protein